MVSQSINKQVFLRVLTHGSSGHNTTSLTELRVSIERALRRNILMNKLQLSNNDVFILDGGESTGRLSSVNFLSGFINQIHGIHFELKYWEW